MKEASLTWVAYNERWYYRGYHDCSSVCHLRLFAPMDRNKPLIAIFTELEENKGTSVTNRIEVLATMVWQWLERPERGMTVVEHYQNRGLHKDGSNRWQFPEQFDLVTFEQKDERCFVRPQWRRVSRQTIEETIGQAFVPILM